MEMQLEGTRDIDTVTMAKASRWKPNPIALFYINEERGAFVYKAASKHVVERYPTSITFSHSYSFPYVYFPSFCSMAGSRGT